MILYKVKPINKQTFQFISVKYAKNKIGQSVDALVFIETLKDTSDVCVCVWYM